MRAAFTECKYQKGVHHHPELLIIELLVRIRSNQRLFNSSIQWFAIDNIRIGSTYAIVLEAFKLGS